MYCMNYRSLHIFIAYLYRTSLLHICTAHLYCICASHICIAYIQCIWLMHIFIVFFIPYLLHTVASLPLTASILFHIFNAYGCCMFLLYSLLHICCILFGIAAPHSFCIACPYCISVLRVFIAYLYCISVLYICITFARCISVLRICTAYLYCICASHICIAYF